MLASSGEYAIIWNSITYDVIRTFQHPDTSVDSIALSSDCEKLITGGGNQKGQIFVWSIESNKLLYSLTGHSKKISTLALSLNNKILVSGSED